MLRRRSPLSLPTPPPTTKIRSSAPFSRRPPRAASSSSSSTSPSNNGDDTLSGSSSAGKIGGSGGSKRGAGDTNPTSTRGAVAAASTATSTATTTSGTTLPTSTSSADDDDLQQQKTSSWEAWQAHFAACDEAAELAEDVSDSLAQAVEAEDYASAATAKRRLDELAAGDAVTRVQVALAEALREEDYAEAARLRDDGGAGLVGWWHGKGGEREREREVFFLLCFFPSFSVAHFFCPPSFCPKKQNQLSVSSLRPGGPPPPHRRGERAVRGPALPGR